MRNDADRDTSLYGSAHTAPLLTLSQELLRRAVSQQTRRIGIFVGSQALIVPRKETRAAPKWRLFCRQEGVT